MGDFTLADSFEVQEVPIGSAFEKVAVIDGVLRDWQALRAVAAGAKFSDVGQNGGFPGLRAPLPATYVKALLQRLDPLIGELFFPGRAMKLTRFDCNFSLVTYPPARLHPRQKLPHVDVADGDRIALLHYLCPAHFGGTAFYRHLASGMECVDLADREAWLAVIRETIAGDLHGYPDDATPGFTRIASFSARPNRLLAYRSHNLHSGVIDRPDLLSEEPMVGRLTANFFLEYAPLDPPRSS
ncbi:MAG: hypothetical protein JY451_10745 [Erythrobacter sp.]|nr:MAG: hypothetical protein JY451_10745 [Erythrobacter sp.]